MFSLRVEAAASAYLVEITVAHACGSSTFPVWQRRVKVHNVWRFGLLRIHAVFENSQWQRT